MTRFVLDTDMVSLLQHGHEAVSRQVRSQANEEIATSIITVEEQLSAWYTLLRKARTTSKLVPIYQRMSETVRFLSKLPLLTFTDSAANRFDQLRKERPRIGRMDLRIASIALARDATLVTRNLSDFEGIENLKVVDWSRE
jgi:tRNA(fMet)-specific endonuclease VapC